MTVENIKAWHLGNLDALKGDLEIRKTIEFCGKQQNC